jgi:hypothetical protein
MTLTEEIYNELRFFDFSNLDILKRICNEHSSQIIDLGETSS